MVSGQHGKMNGLNVPNHVLNPKRGLVKTLHQLLGERNVLEMLKSSNSVKKMIVKVITLLADMGTQSRLS